MSPRPPTGPRRPSPRRSPTSGSRPRDRQRTDRLTTDRQPAANRANAQASTGPTTADGKATSSANAATHGLYSHSAMAIRHGALAEDPDQVAEYLRLIIEDLAPVGPLEEGAAKAVATTLLRLERLGMLESRVLSSAGRPVQSAEKLEPDLYVEDDLRDKVAALEHLLDWLSNPTVPTTSKTLGTLEKLLPARTEADIDLEAMTEAWAAITGNEQADQTLTDKMTRILQENWMGSTESATAWTQHHHPTLSARLEAIEGRATERAAHAYTRNDLDLLTRVPGSLGRQLDQAIARLHHLQARRTEDESRN